ncbi:MAG: MFS transporter [Pseudomonadota bacterium]
MTEAKANNRDFTILFLVMLTTGAGNTALQSVLPTIGRTMGVADSVIAAAFSVSAAIWVITAPMWARRSGCDGRREMVLMGLGGFVGSVALCGVILTAGLRGWIGPVLTMVCFIGARMIYGIFGSAAPPAAQAMVALRTSRANRTKALTMLGSAFGLGTILGPAAAPLLVGLPFVGFAGPAFIFAAGGAVVLWFAFTNLRDDGPDDVGRGAVNSYPSIGGAPAGASITAATADQNSEHLALTDKRIWPWMLMGLTMGHAQAMTGQAIGFLVIDRLGLPLADSQHVIGIVLMVGAGAALLVQWGLIPLLNLAPRNMVILGLIFAATGCGLIGIAESLYGIACAHALACVGFGFTRPGFTAGSSLAVPRSLQGAVAGRVTSVNGAAFVLGPSIGVGLYELYQPLPYFLSAAMLGGLILYALYKIKAAPTEQDD